MAGIFQEGLKAEKPTIITPDMYDITSAMDGKQYIYCLLYTSDVYKRQICDWLLK